MPTPKDGVSVIIPCFNQGHLLGEALDSLQNQVFSNWECVIINDGSTDITNQVARDAERRDQRIRVINQLNSGLSSARNCGIRAAGRKYLQFLDADDTIGPEKLAAQVSFLNQNPGVDLVYSDVRYFSSNQPGRFRHRLLDPDEPWLIPVWSEKRPVLDKLLAYNIMAVNCPLLRASVVDRVGYFDTSLRSVEDWDYWIRCAIADCRFELLLSPGTMSFVRIHEGSMSQDRSRMNAATGQMLLKYFRMGYLPAKSHPHLVDLERRRLLEQWGNRSSGTTRELFRLFQVAPSLYNFLILLLNLTGIQLINAKKIRGLFRWR